MMKTIKDIPAWMGSLVFPSRETKKRHKGYILVEVIAAMTVMAIAGGIVMRTIMSSIEATRTTRDITKALYLTEFMLHNLELRYTRRVDVQLGDFSGYFPQAGTYKFRWFAHVDYDREKDAYVITVRTTWDNNDRYTGSRRRRGRWRRDQGGGITLKTMVLTARYNEDLALGASFGGVKPEIRKRGNARNQRGGKRR